MSRTSQLRTKAQNFLKKGQVDKAIDTYRKLLQVETRNPNLFNELGDIYLRSNDKVQAVSSFEKAIENYEKVALYNNAIAVCKKVLRVVPDRIDAVYKLGELKAKQKFGGEAENLFGQYFDSVLSDPSAVPQGLEEKVDAVLDHLPDCDDIWIKAADVYSHAGLAMKAARTIASLIGRNAGDREKADLYRSRLEMLRNSLKDGDLEEIDGIVNGAVEEEGSGPVEEECSASAGDEAPGGGVEEVASGEQTPDTVTERETAGSNGDEAGIEPAAAGAGEREPAGEYVIEEPEDGETDDEAGGTVDTGEGEEDGTAGEERAAAAEESAAGSSEYAIGEPDEQPSPAATVSEDLSDILDAEDAANEDIEADAAGLAEEITSDVEENDFRSHYDLGMAYIEMALYNEAIKELQISARSDQLQLRSLEMIGHCFIVLNNPRLAVKQLQRGLEIARHAGGDSLGIHYNLGLAYEGLGENDKAREHFEEVYIVDVTFRDITEKMKKYSTVS